MQPSPQARLDLVDDLADLLTDTLGGFRGRVGQRVGSICHISNGTHHRGVFTPVRPDEARVRSVTVVDWKSGLRRVLYPAYEARVVRRLPSDRLPKHVGVMLDGNRRWARSVGQDSAHGHRAGAANIEPLLGWCDEVGIEVVTLWPLPTDNLNRPPGELLPLLEIIEDAVDSLVEQRRWRLHPVGALDLLPSST